MRKYIAVFKIRFKNQIQYRGAALGGLICQGFFAAILIALYRALYAAHPDQSIPLSATVSYVWLQQAFFRMLFSNSSDLSDRIISGDIAYDLLRPLGIYRYYFADNLSGRIGTSLIRALPMLLIALLLPEGWKL